jgi:UDP-N-acetylmuramoyl-tripeptide--D-alanyl-D-alanine ligase
MSFEISNDKITESAKNLTLPTYDEGYGRMYISEINGRTIINDTYNSNSDSALIALDELQSIENRDNKIAVLGDMKELGEASSAEHLKIIEKAVSIADKIILIGPEFRKALDTSGYSNEKITVFQDVNVAVTTLSELPVGSAVLYKGSRSMNIERLVPKNL